MEEKSKSKKKESYVGEKRVMLIFSFYIFILPLLAISFLIETREDVKDDILNKIKEKKHLNIHIFEWDIDVYVPENEEQRYIKAAENASKKIEAYMDLYVLPQFLVKDLYHLNLLLLVIKFQ